MKKWIWLLAICLFACENTLTEASFFVEGNCAECKLLIEQSLAEKPGIKEVQWNPKKSFLSVLFETDKTDLDLIQEIVAEAGFNTQYFDANPAARKKLPACCQERVDRQKIEASPHP